MSSERQRVFDMLVVISKDVGIEPTRQACTLFLKAGMKIGVEQVSRKPISRSLVKQAWSRQGGRCKRCNEPLALDEAEGDHVKAHSLGGDDSPRNIVALHGIKSAQRGGKNCNASKGDNTVFEDSKRTGNLVTDMFPDEEYDEALVTTEEG